jgi:FkbM family methyltransferase
MTNLKRSLIVCYKEIVLRSLTYGFLAESPITLYKLGSEYGGWYVPQIFCEDTFHNKVLISCGIGKDVTFDIEMQKYGFFVIAIDPIKDYCNYAETKLPNKNFLKIINAALSNESKEVILFPPKNKRHHSWSIINQDKSSKIKGEKFKSVTLSDVLNKTSFIQKNCIIVLKLDIEGAERYIFDDIIKNRVVLDFIAIELDFINLIQPRMLFTILMRVSEFRKFANKLKANNYQLISIDGYNFYWINMQSVAKLNLS